MIEIVTERNDELGFLNMDRYGIPPIGSTIIKNKIPYQVSRIIFNEDEGSVSIAVRSEITSPLVATDGEPIIPLDLKSEIIELVSNGTLLAAVKRVKERTKLGLKESKDIVDYYKDLYYKPKS